MKELGIIGVGKMGESILKGIINKKVLKEKEVIIYDVDRAKCALLEKEGFEIASSIEEVFSEAETILLAIKPQNFQELNIKNANKLIISIAAGISINKLKEILGENLYIRVMPNTGALINKSVTVIAADDNVTMKEMKIALKIFNAVGVTYQVVEDQIDDITPINGSMPAYVYYFMKAFIDSAVSRGIDYNLAKEIVANTLITSASMVLENNKSIEELIKDVCSPKGTTIAGLEVLEKAELLKIIDEASIACSLRAKELGKGK